MATPEKLEYLLGNNVIASVTGSILTLTIDMSKVGSLSASGKSKVIASTNGNKAVMGGDNVIVGLNVYTPAK